MAVTRRQTSIASQPRTSPRLIKQRNREEAKSYNQSLSRNRARRGQVHDRSSSDGTSTLSTSSPRKTRRPQLPARTVVQKRRALRVNAPLIGSQLLVVHVGPQLQVLTLHSNLLPEATKIYIEACRVGQWFYALPDIDFEPFCIYRSWLYTNQFHTVAADEEETTQDEDGQDVVADPEWTQLAHCYILGQTLHDERFSNASISALVEKMVDTGCYTTGLASDVYAYTTVGDKLRQLIIDVHVWRGLGWWIHEPHDDARGPEEFLADVESGYAEAGERLWEDGVKMPWEEGVCGKYHVHDVTRRCMDD